MLDVHLPTTDGREIVITRYTQPEKELCLLLDQLNLLGGRLFAKAQSA